MPARKYSSIVEAKTLSAAINNAVTSITLNSVTTLPGSYPYTLVIDPDTAYEEIITVTASGGGNLLTITRGQDSTSAQSHNAGAVVRHMITARDLQEPQDHINASSGVHGVTGAVVGTTDTQTLTNKTIASPVITGTISGTNVVTSTNIVDGTIVNADIDSSAAIVDTKLATITTAGKVANSATTATNANTASAIVARDASGNFIAGTVTANLTGNVTGNTSGTSGSTTGNAATATALATARTINGISFNGTANIRTHNGGQGTTSSSAVETISHGLSTTPSAVSVILRTSGVTTSAVRTFYVSRIGTTSFDIYCNDSTGNQVAAAYYWIATA